MLLILTFFTDRKGLCVEHKSTEETEVGTELNRRDLCFLR